MGKFPDDKTCFQECENYVDGGPSTCTPAGCKMVTPTGRKPSEPRLQNIPTPRTEVGDSVRKAFRLDVGWGDMRFEDSPRAEAIRQDKGLHCENCAREVAEVFEDHYCAECIGMLAGQVSRELRTAPPPNYILSDRTRLVVVMKASEIRTALRGSKLTEECDVVAVDAASGELTAVIKRVRWNPDDCRFELEVGPFLGPAYIPPIEDGYGNAPEAVCENCGAPCEYDSEMCLCERCKWGGRDG